MDRRFNARVRSARPRVRHRGIWVAVISVLIVGVVYLVGYSPLLVLKDVQVTGGPDAVQTQARANAAAPLGRPLARVDTAALEQRVAADNRIQKVDIERSWPSTLSVTLRMRTPAAVLKQPGQRWMLIDAEGVAYRGSGSAPKDLPRITAPRGAVSEAALAGVLAARATLDEAAREDLSNLHVTADGDIRFSVGSIEVLWGNSAQAAAKGAALSALLAQEPINPDGDAELAINVTAPEAPVVTGLTPTQD